jgi:hypothetical protein
MSTPSDTTSAPAGATDTALLDRPTVPPTAAVPPRRWQRIWFAGWRPTVIYLASRVVVLVTMGIVAAVQGGTLLGRINRWDTRWYLRVITEGYPTRLPMIHGHVAANPVAFFPALPLLLHGLAGLLGITPLIAGIVVSGVTGLTATIGVWALVRELAGDRAATRATVLFALFPGSFVFSLVYSEGLVITGVAFGLLALLRRRWVVAGLCGFVATAAAPIALAFVVSCAWAAVVAIRQRREWRALAAPVLAPLGTVIYLLWLWARTGSLTAFTRTERGGWHSFLSIAYPFRIIGHLLAHPIGANANTRLVFFCLVAEVVALVIAAWDRQSAVVFLYGLCVAVLAALTAPVGPRPRLLLDAFPLIVAVALRLKSRRAFTAGTVVSTGLLIAMTAYSVGSWKVFP